MKTSASIIAIVLGLTSQLAHAECVVENDEIAVIGALSRETFAGPPNYESVHKGDQAETYWILTIRDPIAFCTVAATNGKPPTLGSVNRFQLVLNEDQRGVTQSLIARYAVVRGRIFVGHASHHHTSALIEVVEMRPASARAIR
jgi:hypothetical protein